MKTDAAVAQVLERYLDQWETSDSWLEALRIYVRRHINPFVGAIKVHNLDVDVLDSFYREHARDLALLADGGGGKITIVARSCGIPASFAARLMDRGWLSVPDRGGRRDGVGVRGRQGRLGTAPARGPLEPAAWLVSPGR